MKCFSFIIECVVWVAKCLNEDWFNHSVAIAIATTLYHYTIKEFIANVLKCKARLKVKFKCVSITMHSLVMNPFSRDLIKMEID